MNNFDFIVLFFLTFMFIYVTIAVCSIVYLFIELKSLKNSTHNVEYVPLDPNWASSEQDIKDINEKSEISIPDDEILDEHDIDLSKMI